MRTTLTLEPDVAEQIQREIQRTGKAMKAVVNEALRSGLRMMGKPRRPPRFKVQPHSLGVKPGYDLDHLHQLLDELSTDEAAHKLGR